MNIKIAELKNLDDLFELNKLFDNETTKEEMENFLKSNTHEIICLAYINNIAVWYCTGLIVKSVCYKKIV